MRFHTNLTSHDMQQALKGSGVKYADLILTEHGSRSHDRAFEVAFDGQPMKGRRSRASNEGPGISWDEWGLFINSFFLLDPDGQVGGKRGPYPDRDWFREMTFLRFDDLDWEDRCLVHKWERYYGSGMSECIKCGAQRADLTIPSGF